MLKIPWRDLIIADPRPSGPICMVLDGGAKKAKLAALRALDKTHVKGLHLDTDEPKLIAAALHGMDHGLEVLSFGSCNPAQSVSVFEQHPHVKPGRVEFHGPIYSSLYMEGWSEFAYDPMFYGVTEVAFLSDALRDEHLGSWGFRGLLDRCRKLEVRSKYITDLTGLAEHLRQSNRDHKLELVAQSPLILPAQWEWLAEQTKLFEMSSCLRFRQQGAREVSWEDYFGELRALIEEPSPEDDSTILRVLETLHDLKPEAYATGVLPYIQSKRERLHKLMPDFEGGMLEVRELERLLTRAPQVTFALESGDPAGFGDPRWCWLLATPALAAVTHIDLYGFPMTRAEALKLAQSPHAANLEALILGGSRLEQGVQEVLEASRYIDASALDFSLRSQSEGEIEERTGIAWRNELSLGLYKVMTSALSQDGQHAAFSLRDGTLLIKHMERNQQTCAPIKLDAIYAHTILHFDREHTLWVAPGLGEGSALISRYALTGELLSQRQVTGFEGELRSIIAVDAGLLCLELYSERGDAMCMAVAREDGAGGFITLHESLDTEGFSSYAVVDAHQLIGATYTQEAMKLDLKTGALLWSEQGYSEAASCGSWFVAAVHGEDAVLCLLHSGSGEEVARADTDSYCIEPNGVRVISADHLVVYNSYNLELWDVQPLHRREYLVRGIGQRLNQVHTCPEHHIMLIDCSDALTAIKLEL